MDGVYGGPVHSVGEQVPEAQLVQRKTIYGRVRAIGQAYAHLRHLKAVSRLDKVQ